MSKQDYIEAFKHYQHLIEQKELNPSLFDQSDQKELDRTKEILVEALNMGHRKHRIKNKKNRSIKYFDDLTLKTISSELIDHHIIDLIQAEDSLKGFDFIRYLDTLQLECKISCFVRIGVMVMLLVLAAIIIFYRWP